MDASIHPQQALQAILDVIEHSNGDADGFAGTLRREHIPHLSFSQVTTAEFCPYRYHLQYIQNRDPDPVPEYFTKGKLFHQVVAASYREDRASASGAYQLALGTFAREYGGDNQHHLANAFLVHLENYWAGCEVIAVEKPFAMLIDPHLPPCVGVIDLIIKKDSRTIIVDHKTGRDFYPQDELQMAIYVEYMRNLFGQVQYEFYYDHYRWVNNLGRIRKPAFQRTCVSQSASWSQMLERIRRGNDVIERIKSSGRGARIGECFRCPYRRTCHPING